MSREYDKKYRGYRISQNIKIKYHTNKRSGHIWSEDILLNTYSINGPFMIPNSHDKYKSIKKARGYIDFLIKFEFNKPEKNGC